MMRLGAVFTGVVMNILCVVGVHSCETMYEAEFVRMARCGMSHDSRLCRKFIESNFEILSL